MKHAYYFTHDFNARSDTKTAALLYTYKAQGYGWFWILVEMLAEEAGHRLPVNGCRLEGMAMQCRCGAAKLKEFIHDCIHKYELFKSDGEYFWSESLMRRIGVYEDVKRAKSEAGKKGMKVRWNGEGGNASDNSVITDNNSVITDDNSVITDDNSVITDDNKGKESKSNKRREKERRGEYSSLASGAGFDGQPYEEAYNRICTRLPRVLRLSEERLKALQAFAGEYSLADFIAICENVNGNSFMNGDNPRRWKANFDYLIRPDRAAALLEGHYNMERQPHQARQAQPDDPAERSFEELAGA